ncbi:hypothetical protein HYQ45_011880 [Verticillium longisporum]|uniref:NAD-dependent epimerase/dehydratase domain-containing protein n=1 Tax=Verticillium longisporum TaxID=100787 RepID=A0A8I3AMG0_VERLO|nr:hypothetical protein HYQ45_011880 [Verticillium longisporum]
MAANILITGGSGYLGGSLLQSWTKAQISGYGRLLALVRTDDQATAVEKLYGAEPVRSSLQEDDVAKLIIDNRITIVLYLLDAYTADGPFAFIKGLSALKKATGQDVHLIFTTGTKQFSSLAGAPTDELLLDTDPNLYTIQSKQKTQFKEMKASVETNCTLVEAAEEYDVRLYLLSPCIVYGEGTGFGNKISIQTVDVVVAAQGSGHVYKIGSERQAWAVCHISDCISLYTTLVKAILRDDKPGHGKYGYYLASSGRVFWDEIYASIAKALVKRNIIKDATVRPAADGALKKMAEALNVEPSSVVVKISGESTYTAKHGRLIGWQPEYPPEHILEMLDEEVELILKHIDPKLLRVR